MKITYKSNKLQKQLTIPKELAKAFGQRSKKVNQRMKELEAADTLEVMRWILAANCHELKGDRQGELAVDVSANFRLIFEPDHKPLPQKEDGGLDWGKVTAIRILEIEDYH
ncbi:MAG: killer suppression protein HigA [Bacteroidia bacterium]